MKMALIETFEDTIKRISFMNCILKPQPSREPWRLLQNLKALMHLSLLLLLLEALVF